MSRFISTHPDQDHLGGLILLDDAMPIWNFYCIRNQITKEEETEDFKHYKKLRDGDKAYFLQKGMKRKWFNDGDEQRSTAGLQVVWPDVGNMHFQDALATAENGGSPNNTSIILRYGVGGCASFLWMGDMETEFMEAVEYDVAWPQIDILFAPHHGRDSGRVPTSILNRMDPKLIVLGEAPSEHLCYYADYNTITQNSAGTIAFETAQGYVHIYVSNENYSVDFLENVGASTYSYYLGSLKV
jgi:beta-lactamase superfamily II metal-dependent hydrolase